LPFRIDESPERIVASDRPTGMWMFGSVFILSGLVVLSIPFVSTSWAGFVLWQRAAVVAIGVGHLAAGAWTVWSHVETRTIFNRASGEGLHVVRRPFARRTTATQFNVEDVRAIESERATDSDGDPMYRLRMWLSGSRVLALQGQPAHGEAHAAESRLRVALGLGEKAESKITPVTGAR
jgi:hypothetical protein